MPKKTFKKDWSSINKKIKDRKKKFKKDERIFSPTFDEKNQAKVIMRFLDSPDIDMPYAEQQIHFFNDEGGWFIENCPTTIEEPCPVCEDLYKNNYYETDNDLYFDRKKSVSYYTNALIIEDKNNPLNEGKVFLLKFGVKIMEKIDDIIDENKVPWDDNVGVNFIFSAKKKGKMSNYDASRFSDTETPLSDYGDVDELNGRRYDLAEFSDPKAFKSYDELKELYEKKTGSSSSSESSSESSSTRRKKKPVKQEDEIEENEEVIDERESEDNHEIDDEVIGDEKMYENTDDDDDDFFSDMED